ncbi:torsin-1A-interacting protein 2-like isoform X1 [Leucoraja erinacea]|uniref:torsin-1A-interacting protein 2-like isoform X1 n=1 Tax=Leucoraja erinaceus TaxID=7782 RepID=UPI0024538364|nr:torsin-1A-interacting protein 2-like isoform X1 [Leucoraja erinacea]
MRRRSNRNKSAYPKAFRSKCYQQRSNSSEPSKKSQKEQSQALSSKADLPTEGERSGQIHSPINSSSIGNEGDQMVTPRPSIRNARKRNVDRALGLESSDPEKKSRKDGAAAEVYPQINMDHRTEALESQSISESEKMDCSDDVNLDAVPCEDGNQAEENEVHENPADEDVNAESEMEFDRVQNCSGSTLFTADVHCHPSTEDCTDSKQSSHSIRLNASVDADQRLSNIEPCSFTATKQTSQFPRQKVSDGVHQCSSYRGHRSFIDTKQSSQFSRPNALVVSHQLFSHQEPSRCRDRTQSSQFIGPNVSGSRFLFWKLAIPLMALITILSIFVCYHWPSETTADQLINEREVHLLNNWKEIQNRFPNQRQELWARSKTLLLKHAATVTHTRPAVLMFTAAHDAKETLRCLARGMAGAYASVFNSSVVEVDASEKKSLNSDQVKLDMDNQLSSEFQKGRKAAVIHHFHDLPPASSLLFYKYCDHENAAFKDVPMLITVSLDKSSLNPDLSLLTIEKMVQNFLKMKFCSETQGGHNGMDADKLSGLWSRIAHVVLPVSPEKEIEAEGCPLF